MEVGERLFGSRWFMAQVEKESKRDEIPGPERMGQLLALAGSLIVVAFLAIHQTRPTGFFTDEYGTGDAVLLYGMIVVGMIPMLIRFVTGRRNPSRPADAIGLALFFVGGLYFLISFPFDFAFFAEAFPDSLEFLISWVSAGLAKLVLGLGVVASPFFSVYTMFLYVSVRKRLAGAMAASQKEGS